MEVDDGVTDLKCFKNCNNYISKYPINNDVDTSGMPTEPIAEANVGDIQLTQFDTQTQLTETDVEVAAHRLYELIQDFENNISDIKINLEEAKIKYPYSEAIKEVEELWKYVVGKYFLGENNKTVGGDHVNDLENSPNYLTPRTIEELDRHVKAYTDSTTPLKQTLVFSRPKFDIGSSGNVPKSVSVGEIIVTDYVMAGDHVEGKEDNKVEEQAIRPQTFCEGTCSPYVQRVVQLKEPVTKPENLVSDMIYAAYGGTWEVVFRTGNGISVGRVVMETMRPGLYIHVSAVSSWAEVLNTEEMLRKNETTHRLFCSAVMLFPTHYHQDKATQIAHFMSNMVSVLKQQDRKGIAGVDLVFIPIPYPVHYHYYVMVFNLNNGRIELLDNIKFDADFNELYGKWPFIMRDTFAEYLHRVKHRMASKIAKSDVVVIDMPWRTQNNYVDCGVFAMRHMETYRGGSVKEWDGICNLSREVVEHGIKQQKELDELRRKYVSKILLSEINLAKNDLLERALIFDALPLDEKVEFYNNAVDRIKIRLEEVD